MAGAWTELLRLYVRDVLSREVDARGGGTHTLQQSPTLKADTMRASDKMHSCNIRAALQILQTNLRAPPNTQTAAEVHSLVAVDTDEREIARIKMQCVAIKQAAVKFSPPPAKQVKRMARGVVLAAQPGPNSWRNADIAAIGRTKGGPAVLREWMGTWAQAAVPHQMAKLWTAATIAPFDCGPKKLEPCPRKLRPTALAEVLVKLTESCIIEQHSDRLRKGVEPTDLGLGTPDAAALIVRIVQGWANDMVGAPEQAQDADVVPPIDLENAYGRAFRSTCLEAARALARSWQRSAQHNGDRATRGFGRDAMMAGLVTVRREEAGRAPELRKLCLCLGWSLPSPSQMQQRNRKSQRLALRTTWRSLGPLQR